MMDGFEHDYSSLCLDVLKLKPRTRRITVLWGIALNSTYVGLANLRVLLIFGLSRGLSRVFGQKNRLESRLYLFHQCLSLIHTTTS
jgi:hypothetical protein